MWRPFHKGVVGVTSNEPVGFEITNGEMKPQIWQVHQLKGFYFQKGGFLELDVFQFQKLYNQLLNPTNIYGLGQV